MKEQWEAQGLQQRIHFLQAAAAIDDVCVGRAWGHSGASLALAVHPIWEKLFALEGPGLKSPMSLKSGGMLMMSY